MSTPFLPRPTSPPRDLGGKHSSPSSGAGDRWTEESSNPTPDVRSGRLGYAEQVASDEGSGRLRASRDLGGKLESVWDYPRPPRLERTPKRLVVEIGGVVVADTTSGYRVLETSQAPAYYLPPSDVDLSVLRPSAGASFCEWKGSARYWTAVVGDLVVDDVAWSYPEPTPPFEPIRDHLAFYPARVGACSVDGVPAEPMPGGFYGGWVTPDIVGPIKGAPGTLHW